ncbi:YolD-like family protein [Neobacillus sp. FSL H8-0543]|uniref:YolD-like family protein n=1 Tax=Neobacillus sp. FSL H8-0543 TaxID=2954672 RepID=UPI00315821B0
MGIRDRGKLKWRPASFMPLGFEMTRAMFKDQERKAKPLIDEYEAEEFDRQINYAKEYKLLVRVSVWEEGFTTEMIGRIHSLDPIKHQLRLEVRTGEYEVIAFEKVIGVIVTN